LWHWRLVIANYPFEASEVESIALVYDDTGERVLLR